MRYLKIILLVFICAAGLLILEFSSRKILETTKLQQKIKYAEDRLKDKTHIIGCFDEYLGWGYRPNASERQHTSDFDVVYAINSKGFRDKEVPESRFSGEFRMVALGESNVFGEGINYGERFTEIIENSLKNVEVINMGVWGFGADQSLLQLERDGIKFKADVVVLFVIRDFLERCKLYKRLESIKPRFVLSENKKDIVLEDLNFIQNRLVTDTGSETLQNQMESGHKKTAPSFLAKSSLFTLLDSKKRMLEINKIISDKDASRWRDIGRQLDKDVKRGSQYDEKDFKQFVFLMLKRYKEICNRNSADFVIIYIDVDKEYFSRLVVDSARVLGIDYLDLSDVLRRASSKNPLRFNIDPHYNEFAHRVIGEAVSDYLMKKYKFINRRRY
ncbi:MAG: hypothetical protein WC060_03345 [Candidatus Omnitrophota bacterium]